MLAAGIPVFAQPKTWSMNLLYLVLCSIFVNGAATNDREMHHHMDSPRLYFTEKMQTIVEIGEPPQKILARIDTHFDEIFAVSSSLFNCTDFSLEGDSCVSAKELSESPLFDSAASQTANSTDDLFKATTDQGTATGNWVHDILTFHLSKKLESIDGFGFGVVNKTDTTSTIGLARSLSDPTNSYMGFLKNNGAVSSISYSMWVRGSTDSTHATGAQKGSSSLSTRSTVHATEIQRIGTVLFGAVDSNAYKGTLWSVPMIETNGSESTAASVSLNGVHYKPADGQEKHLAYMAQKLDLGFDSVPFKQPSVMPPALLATIQHTLKGEPKQNLSFVDCYSSGSLHWNFSGAIIETPVSSFIDMENSYRADDTTYMCALNIVSGDQVKFNLQVLRNFFTVINFDAGKVGLAAIRSDPPNDENLSQIDIHGIPNSQEAPFPNTDVSDIIDTRTPAKASASATINRGGTVKVTLLTLVLPALSIFI